MSFLFGGSRRAPPPVIAPPLPIAPPTAAPEAKSEVQEVIDVQAEAAAAAEVKKTKKKRGFLSTILTSGEGLLTEAPVKKKKLGE